MKKKTQNKDEFEEKQLYKQALGLYENGRYEEALRLFQLLLEGVREEESGFYYYVKFCKNVINTPLSKEDETYEKESSIRKYVQLLWVPIVMLLLPLVGLVSEEPTFSFFSAASVIIGVLLIYIWNRLVSQLSYGSSFRQLRCKYCGHYTEYIAPNEGWAYMGTNNCSVCGRGYPMPSAGWDTHSGRAYMYERGSVTEPEFYREFEEENPTYPRSEMADRRLRKKKKNV